MSSLIFEMEAFVLVGLWGAGERRKTWHRLPVIRAAGKFRQYRDGVCRSRQSPRAKRLLKQSGVLGGWGNGSSVNDAGSWGYYWSSTYYNTNNAYILGFYSGGVNPQNWNNKNNGFAVRCVKKSEGKRVKKLKS